MENKDSLYSYYATLIAICYLTTVAAILAWGGKYTEALGFGGIIVGLIGVAKLPGQRSVTIDNKPSDPVPTTEGS